MKKYLILFSVLVLGCKNAPEQKPIIEKTNETEVIFEQLSEKYPHFTEGLNGPMDGCVKMKNDQFEMTAGKETDFFIEPGSPTLSGFRSSTVFYIKKQ